MKPAFLAISAVLLVTSSEDVDTGVTLSSDRKALELGVKLEGQWKYQRLDLSLGQLK